MPRLIPDECIGECVLNETRILVNHRFHVEQAIKVLSARVPNGTLTWMHAVEVAARKCYILQVVDTFYLQQVAENSISPECIPSSYRFLVCTFSIAYRDCPDAYWDIGNELCREFVVALNNCLYLFKHMWEI
uniref:Uncharacterized protein n=1 Tax=Anopheles epiroticus TaxID=199890 RepID=A0A9I3FHC5_9DIPT